jgi:medium-chain acyl-[acyl-carrier-protein] hydrolase
MDDTGARAVRWLGNPRQSDRAQVRVFGLPHAGAGIAAFVPSAHALPADMELRPIRLPGRENRIAEEPVRSMAALLSELLSRLRPTLETDQLPYILVGSCSGAIMAYELARCLQSDGPRAPSLLVVAGQTAPHRPEFVPREPLYGLPGHVLRQRLRAAELLPRTLAENDNLWRLVEPAIRADFEIVERYRYTPEPMLEVPILALRGHEDRIVSGDDLAAWSALTTGTFTQTRLSGGHDVLRDPVAFAGALAAEWNRLDAAESPRSGSLSPTWQTGEGTWP